MFKQDQTARSLSILAYAVLVISALALLIGGLYAVYRRSGATNTEVQTAYCLVLLIASCAIFVVAAKVAVPWMLAWTLVLGAIVVTYVQLDRFDKFYLSWLSAFPALFAVGLVVLVIREHKRVSNLHTPCPPQAAPSPGGQTASRL